MKSNPVKPFWANIRESGWRMCAGLRRSSKRRLLSGLTLGEQD
jgi:hypothetical protein